MEILLGLSDPMEEMNKFMRDGIFMEEGDFLNGVEDDRYFKDGSIERVNSMYGQERRVD